MDRALGQLWAGLKRLKISLDFIQYNGGESRGRVQGVRTPPPPEMTFGFLIQLVFCEKKTMWFIGVEVEQETSAPPPKKNPGSALGAHVRPGSDAVLFMSRT